MTFTLSYNQNESSSSSSSATSSTKNRKNFDAIIKIMMTTKKSSIINSKNNRGKIMEEKSQGLQKILKFNQNLFGDRTPRNSQAVIMADNDNNNRINISDSTRITYLIIHHVLRLLVLILCIIGCMVQIISIVNIFFGYPAIVFVNIHQMDRLTLPGITICNNNRVMRSKLNAYDAKFAYKWNVLMNRTTNNHQFKLYQQRLIDNLIRSMLTNLTVSEFMSFGNTADDFLDVDFFRCASDKNHPDKKCIYLSNLFTTAQEHGNCFTLFHKSNSTMLETISIESGLSESAVVRGLNNESVDIEMSMKPFAPNEILRFRVNFEEDEYTTLNEPISGRFIIHDNSQIAVIREKSYRIKPGKYYIFYISKYTDRLLPAPYVTDCRDYDVYNNNNNSNNNNNADGHKMMTNSNNNNISNDSLQMLQNQQSMEKTEESNNLLFRAPASKANCVIGCMARKTIETCNCWPPELPFLFNAQLNASENQLKWCDWREKPPIKKWQDKSSNQTWFQYCFNKHEDECNSHCKSDCRIDRYRIISEEIEWPSKERIEHTDDNDLRRLKSCCAVISIRYWSAEQKINQYKPRFEIAEFTSNIGGLLSMWLGFSLFGFYNLNEKFFVRLWRHCMGIKQQQNTTTRNDDNDDDERNLNLNKNQRQSYHHKRSYQFSDETIKSSKIIRKSDSNGNSDEKEEVIEETKKSTIRRIPLSKRRIFQNVVYKNNKNSDSDNPTENTT
ncbi:amiloride-sensitive sodium channel [Dermatophagoides farinae]|uniref:Amiloride-sensitive sodium channel n=2 Tax=Dermatophagoides farinae TaxID=6954 RepID=A0A922L6J6_DERFA|nr:amiloride-sensitive sodium channel [Dermatophagoides farinae]